MDKIRENQVLVTGGNGNLANEFKKIYSHWFYFDKNELDITDKKQIKKAFKEIKPVVVLHLAAYTDVQKAESEKKLCHKINVIGARNIAETCLKNNCVFVNTSSNYVYTGQMPFSEKDRIKPIHSDYYSKTKYKAEKEIQKILRNRKYYILRLGNLFGGDNDKKITTILKNWDKPEFNAVKRYIHPAYAPDMAEIIGKYFIIPLIEKTGAPPFGIYNIANEEYCAVYDYAKKAFEILRKNIKINTVDEIEEKAKRRSYAMDLSKIKRLGISPRKWQEALKEYLNRNKIKK